MAHTLRAHSADRGESVMGRVNPARPGAADRVSISGGRKRRELALHHPPCVPTITPLLDGGRCEAAAATLGVETPASLEVAVNELGVLACRAEDSKCVGRAERRDLLRKVRLHRPERRASGGSKHRPNVYPCLPCTANQTQRRFYVCRYRSAPTSTSSQCCR